MTVAAWMVRALCVGADPEIWFDGRRTQEAQRICAACPVMDTCRSVGANEYRGTWGGVVRKAASAGPSTTAPYIGYEHGTDAGYSHHLREGTTPCTRCVIAHRFAQHKYYGEVAP